MRARDASETAEADLASHRALAARESLHGAPSRAAHEHLGADDEQCEAAAEKQRRGHPQSLAESPAARRGCLISGRRPAGVTRASCMLRSALTLRL